MPGVVLGDVRRQADMKKPPFGGRPPVAFPASIPDYRVLCGSGGSIGEVGRGIGEIGRGYVLG